MSAKRGTSSAPNGPAGPTGGRVKEMAIDEHMMDIKDVEAKYETDIKQGLRKEQAEQRLLKYGKNQLTPPKQIPEYIKFMKQLSGGFSLLLWFGATLCLFVYTINSFKQGESDMDDVSLLKCLRL